MCVDKIENTMQKGWIANKITEGFTYSIVKKKKEEEEEDRSLMTLHQREHKGNKNIVHVCKVAMILFYSFKC